MGYFDDDGFLDEHIIKDRSVLKPEHKPEKLEERDEELEDYVKLLRPLLKGWDLDNIFLYGHSGVGKTVATRTLLPDLRDKAEDQSIDVDILEINCSSANTSYQSTIELINEARNPEYPLTTLNLDKSELSKTGYPAEQVYEELFDDLHEGAENIILVLDEVNTLGSDSELLYQLTRAQTMHKLEAELCIIGISNDFNFRDDLPARVKDTLCETELHFPAYEQNDLISILSRRAEQAFYEGTSENGVIELSAALASRDRGSARQAIRLLRKAAELAENEAVETEDTDCIEERHVRNAEDIIERKQVTTGIRKLTSHRKYVLLATTNLSAQGNTPAQTRDIYEYYKSVAEEFGRDPLTRRGAHEHLLEMCDNGILKNVNRDQRGRGRPNKYKLDTPLETVIDALEQEEDGEIGDLDSLREQANQQTTLTE
ncbi:Cdc6/Cdc18 family protein [Halorussus marinus]|uniref:Cdc6/Cdc18 family protein n=1 Tax=Halorussus marinus TaxID=2505976 RepID=UPI00106E31D7|nr:AAA family ATPase [Halorussus marinus]